MQGLRLHRNAATSMSHKTASASRVLNGEELLFLFSRNEPKQLAGIMTHLADENARLKERQRKDHLHILGAQNGSGKSNLEWINNVRLVGAHIALTTRGDYSNSDAAATLIKWRPAIAKLLRKNQKAEKDRKSAPFSDEQRIIQLRKNFQSSRATKNEAGRLAYRYARKVINRDKHDPDALEELAAWLILTIELDSR
jgi:hypothetical protein